MSVDYSAYEGKAITGRVDTVLCRGRLVIEAGRYVGKDGHGTFLPRNTNEYLI